MALVDPALRALYDLKVGDMYLCVSSLTWLFADFCPMRFRLDACQTYSTGHRRTR